MSFTRRQVLAGLAGLGVVGLGAGGVRYWLGLPENVATPDYELIAAPVDMELVPGHVTPAWGYGGQAPGLELRCRQGERLRVRFINKLEQQSTIHWHG
ncbi:multicopper oxidase domain-containing protein, partial [Alloalcanivorax venustensis]|uniref:multicopper oxidase domain-containing protein n=1 Tax=Alloalcanivorax venustensis TaxID=172371 RepID=UPI003518E52C